MSFAARSPSYEPPETVVPAKAGTHPSDRSTVGTKARGWSTDQSSAVVLLDYLNFPGPPPFFDLLLALPGAFPRLVGFEPDKAIDAVFGREARNNLVFVFPNAPNEIVRHADIQGSMRLAGQQIDEECSATARWVPAFAGTSGFFVKYNLEIRGSA